MSNLATAGIAESDVIILTALPRAADADINTYNAGLISTYTDATIIDINPFFNDGSDNLVAAYDCGDAIHLNDAGQTLITEVLNSTLTYTFTDTDAFNYWNGLTLANGTTIDASTVYGVTTDSLVTAIDNHVIQLKADGVWPNLVRYYPFIGGTDATHAIDMVSATSILTYGGTNPPALDKYGMRINNEDGSYANANNDPSTELTLNDTHLMIYSFTADWDVSFGTIIGTDRLSLFSNSGITLSDVYKNSVASRASVADNHLNIADGSFPMMSSRRSSTDNSLYLNAVEIDTTTGSDGALTASSILIGAIDLNGVPSYPTTGNICASSWGTALSAGEVTAFNTELKSFKYSLMGLQRGTLTWTATTGVLGSHDDGNTLTVDTSAALTAYTTETVATADIDFKYTAYTGGSVANNFMGLCETSAFPPTTYLDCQFVAGIQNDGKFRVSEYGVSKYLSGILTKDEERQEIRILNDAGTVKYYLGGVLKYTSGETPSGSYHLTMDKQGTVTGAGTRIAYHLAT